MKKITLFCLIICSMSGLDAQNRSQVYDSTLAKSFGADDYGMKTYVFVLLKSGSNNMEKGAARDSIFSGHIKNIRRLADEGKLVIAGPFEDNDKSFRGIFILNVKTIEEARELLKSDPAVHAKILDAELYGWYGSAAIGEYLKIQKSIEKKSY